MADKYQEQELEGRLCRKIVLRTKFRKNRRGEECWHVVEECENLIRAGLASYVEPEPKPVKAPAKALAKPGVKTVTKD